MEPNDQINLDHNRLAGYVDAVAGYYAFKKPLELLEKFPDYDSQVQTPEIKEAFTLLKEGMKAVADQYGCNGIRDIVYLVNRLCAIDNSPARLAVHDLEWAVGCRVIINTLPAHKNPKYQWRRSRTERAETYLAHRQICDLLGRSGFYNPNYRPGMSTRALMNTGF